MSWARMRNTPGLFSDILIIVLMLGLGSATTYVLVSNYDVKPPWQDRFEFAADFDMAPGIQLASRQEVRIAGVSVGKIVDAAPVDGGARLTFAIDPEQTVYRDARVMVRSKTPVNIMYVTLDPGTEEAGPLPEGGTIPLAQTDRVTQAFETLDQLDARTRSAVGDLLMEGDVALTDASKTLPAGLRSTEAATRSFTPVIEALAERRANLRSLVTSLAQISDAAGSDQERLALLMDSLQSTLAAVAERDGQLGTSLAKLPGLTSTLRSSLQSTRALTTELDPTLDALTSSSDRLPDVVARLTSTVGNARDVIRSARPVVAGAKPVLADLRPLTSDLQSTVAALAPTTALLPDATARLTPWLTNLGAFVYNTSSSFSLGDANGGMGRANLVVEVLEPTGAPLKDLVK